MRCLLLYLSVFVVVHCSSCPDGFELVRDGECRGNYTRLTVYWQESERTADEKCEEVHGKALIIHDEEHHWYWVNRIADGSHRPALAIICNMKTKIWEWSDGSQIDFKPPSYDGLLNLSDCTPKYLCGWYLVETGSWAVWCTGPESTYTIDVFCTTQLQLPAPSANGCESFEDDSEDGVCYQVAVASQSWQDAQRSCKINGGDLASIHSLQENSFIRRLAVSRGAVNGLFLGATVSGKENNFSWIDGSEWDYDYFYPGFPLAGQGDCLAMDTLAPAGEWLNKNCSSELAFACIRQEGTFKPFCPPGPWKEGQIITSPGFPFDASTPCEFILTVDAGKKVEVEVQMLEANTCCDHLVLADDLIGGNIVANLTGEVDSKKFTTKSSNLMRVSWQPNGAVNVRGMMMTFRGV